ncbi:MAG: S1 RNA-binding domain-containing protein [Anaerolineaceae bacterium]|jgi:ribosomal protein S1
MENSAVAVAGQTNEITPKMHFTGKVSKVSLAGALIDIGVGKAAVLHVSQIKSPDDQPIKRVEDVLQVGQEIEVWVRKVKEERIELTMFKPLELDWRDIKKDMIVKGTVVRLEKFGAFVEIGAERPGLIHISEMTHGYVRTPGDVVKEGDELEAQVIDVNRKKKQIKLSMKALQPEPEETEPAPAAGEAKKERGTRPARKGNRKNRDESESVAEYENSKKAEKAVPEPTAMEIALRDAMDKAKSRKNEQEEKVKKGKAVSKVQEDILERTLEQKVQTK